MAGRVRLRPATSADVEAMLAEPLPFRVRAFAAVLVDPSRTALDDGSQAEGELLGIGGLAFLPDGTVGAFVHAREGAHRFKVAFHRAGLMAMAEARRLGIQRVVALAEDGVAPAERWLKRLGFEEHWFEGKQVFVWQVESG